MAITGRYEMDGEETLDQIIQEIYAYLQSQHLRRFNRFLGNGGDVNKIAKSWTELNIQLSHFVKDPKNEYSKVMATIEQEKEKFRTKPEYVNKLNKLEAFLRKSPRFSEEYQCRIHMPDGFEKRKNKKKG